MPLRGLGQVSKWHVCGRGKKALNNQFFRKYIEISLLGRNVLKMALN